jgi:23S rRNA pseudouridine1911/1915/1917 synthase
MTAFRSDDVFSHRACAWPPRPQKQSPVRMIAPQEVPPWIVYEDEQLLVVNKPGDIVCHPSKAGPWSSLVGALREHTGLPTVHLVFRLDRETSGIVVLAKNSETARRLQMAMQKRRIGKVYLAVMTGVLRGPVTVDQALGDDVNSVVFLKSAVTPYGQRSVTHFTPLAVVEGTGPAAARSASAAIPPGSADAALSPAPIVRPDAMQTDAGPAAGFTLVRVVTETGRKHQIRAHAQWLGHSLVGDKIYGPDARCYLEFIDHGWTENLQRRLLLPRQALHCAEIDLRAAGFDHVFTAPLPDDLRAFCAEHGLSTPAVPPG